MATVRSDIRFCFGACRLASRERVEIGQDGRGIRIPECGIPCEQFRDDHPKRRARLTALDPQFLKFCRHSEPHIVAFQTCVAEKNRIC